MIVYHGTTRRRARQIAKEGFLPKRPSRRVWFAESRRYALGRAKTQARRTADRPVVLTCNLDLQQIRGRLGGKRVMHKNRVIAINAPVSCTVLRSHPSTLTPSSPRELAAWVCHVLGLKPYKGPGWRHPGIDRLSRWVVHRLAAQPKGEVPSGELLQMARQWLPEFFQGVEIDPDTLRVHRQVETLEVTVEVDSTAAEPDPREDEALECLLSPKARRRVRGLKLLAAVEDLDLFEWCAMFLEDPSAEVRVAALHTMLRCRDADVELVEPLADSEDKRIRAAAVAALAKHSAEDAPYWFERGLHDYDACVRLETAALLPELDTEVHRTIFEYALHDSNERVARLARRATAGKGYHVVKW